MPRRGLSPAPTPRRLPSTSSRSRGPPSRSSAGTAQPSPAKPSPPACTCSPTTTSTTPTPPALLRGCPAFASSLTPPPNTGATSGSPCSPPLRSSRSTTTGPSFATTPRTASRPRRCSCAWQILRRIPLVPPSHSKARRWAARPSGTTPNS